MIDHSSLSSYGIGAVRYLTRPRLLQGPKLQPHSPTNPNQKPQSSTTQSPAVDQGLQRSRPATHMRRVRSRRELRGTPLYHHIDESTDRDRYTVNPPSSRHAPSDGLARYKQHDVSEAPRLPSWRKPLIFRKVSRTSIAALP